MAYAIGQSRLRDLIEWIRAVIGDDARAWGLSRRGALGLVAFPVALAAAAAIAQVDPVLYRFITAEDSILEWSQVLAVGATAILLAVTAVLFVRRSERRWAALFGGAALVMVVVAGEEISWGQRIFAITTPEQLAAINTQGETNLHNVKGVLRPLNFIWMMGAGIAAALPFAYLLVRSRGLAGPRSLYRFVPPLALVTAFAIPFVYRFGRFIFEEGTSGSFAEVVELLLYFGLMAFAFLLLRRIASEGGARTS